MSGLPCVISFVIRTFLLGKASQTLSHEFFPTKTPCRAMDRTFLFMWVLYQVVMNFQEVFSNFSVLPGQMLQQLEQNAPEPRSGIARRRGLLIRNAQRRIILRDAHSDRHTRFVLSSPNLLCTAKPPRRTFLHAGAVRVIPHFGRFSQTPVAAALRFPAPHRSLRSSTRPDLPQ